MLAEIAGAIQTKQVQALLLVTPISGRYLTHAAQFLPRDAKKARHCFRSNPRAPSQRSVGAYESFDIPKGTIRGSPAIPDDDLTTLRVPVYLIAKEKLSDDTPDGADLRQSWRRAAT